MDEYGNEYFDSRGGKGMKDECNRLRIFRNGPGRTDRVELSIPKKEQVNLRFEENFKKENCDFWDAMHEKHGNIYV